MFNDPSIHVALGIALEKCLNTALKYDPGTRYKIEALAGTQIKVCTHAPDITLIFIIEEKNIRVQTVDEDIDADVTISGLFTDFLALVGQDSHSLSDLNIEISGKVSLLNTIKEILSDIDIDWEEPLTEWLGTVPGHAAAKTIRQTFSWSERQKKQFEERLPEYLTEELKAIPSRTELTIFYESVDELASHTQRLEARLARLKPQPQTQ